jgi:hypothetical protein
MISRHQTSRQYSAEGHRRRRRATGSGWQPLNGWRFVHLADAGNEEAHRDASAANASVVQQK